MIQFILTDILMLSLGAMLFMVARALPRVTDEGKVETKPTLIERWFMSDLPHKVDTAMNSTTGKLFRRLKVALMKVDNYLTERLKNMSQNGNGKPKIDFNDIAEKDELVAKKEDLTQNKE